MAGGPASNLGPEPQPQPGQVEQDVQIFAGSVASVHYLGPSRCRNWNPDELTTTFWLAPDLGQAIMLRSDTECMLSDTFRKILQTMMRESGGSLEQPILTFNGSSVLSLDRVSQLSTGDTLIIWNQAGSAGIVAVPAQPLRTSRGQSVSRGKKPQLLISATANYEALG